MWYSTETNASGEVTREERHIVNTPNNCTPKDLINLLNKLPEGFALYAVRCSGFDSGPWVFDFRESKQS